MEPPTYGSPHQKENTEGREGTKLGNKVKGTLIEVKMSRIRNRSDVDQEKKKHSTVLGVVCTKWTPPNDYHLSR